MPAPPAGGGQGADGQSVDPRWLPSRRDGAVAVVFGLLYAAAVVTGRVAIGDGNALHLVLPAALVGGLWLLASRNRAHSRLHLAVLGAVAATVNALTGVALALCVVLIAASAVQAAVAVALLRPARVSR